MKKSEGMTYAVFFVIATLVLFFIVLPLARLLLFINPETAYVMKESSVLTAIWNSISMSFLTAVIAFFIGVPLAFLFSKRKFGKLESVVETVADVPMAVPHTVTGIALLFVIGRREIVGSFFYNTFGFQLTGTRVAIVIAMLFVGLPYTIDSAKEGFKKVDPSFEKVAQTLGAPMHSIFTTVYLPLAKSSILSGFMLTWARAISEFGAVVILAYYPMTAPVKVYDSFTQYNLSVSGAIAAYFLIICLAIFLTFRFITARRK